MKSPENPINCFFVYGTLCRGQCRENLWPATPGMITPAWVFGELYGRSDYPAMRPGNERIAGECWQFEQSDVPEVIRVLDLIEGTNQPGRANLYDRVVVDVFDFDSAGKGIPAHGYHYATDPIQSGFGRIQPDHEGCCRWPIGPTGLR